MNHCSNAMPTPKSAAPGSNAPGSLVPLGSVHVTTNHARA